jgi:hypothetical protein
MRRTHAGLERLGRGGIALERQQAVGQRLNLAFRVEAEQLEH